MPFDAPFALGPFTVDSSGRLQPAAAGQFPAFRLCWRGREVEVALLRLAADPQGGSAGVLALYVMAGRVPSTAGAAPDAALARRAAVFALLAGVAPLLPPGWRIGLQADHRVQLIAELALALPASATALLSVVTGCLLDAAPYLDLLDESGVAAGTVKTCPG